jgi:hypothetical protein
VHIADVCNEERVYVFKWHTRSAPHFVEDEA